MQIWWWCVLGGVMCEHGVQASGAGMVLHMCQKTHVSEDWCRVCREVLGSDTGRG